MTDFDQGLIKNEMRRLNQLRTKWKNQIINNEFPELFESMKKELKQGRKAYDEYIIHHSNLNDYLHDERIGIIGKDESTELRRIKKAVVDFIAQLTIDDLNQVQDVQTGKVWLIRVSLVISLVIIGYVGMKIPNFDIEQKTAIKGDDTTGHFSPPIEPKLSMVFVKGGKFFMGCCKENETKDQQKHMVTLDGFWIAPYELTNQEYERFCEATVRSRKKVSKSPANHPVVFVSWNDALDYCNWLSKQHGLQPVYDKNYRFDWKANGYRLPTEAEWEYAARQGGQDVLFGNGQSTARIDYINFNDSNKDGEKPTKQGESLPVDALNSPNSLGLYHMSGNVWEWCWDWYDRDYYLKSSKVNPKGPNTGEDHVLRGGSYLSTSHKCEVFFRNKSRAIHSDVGFRLARNAK